MGASTFNIGDLFQGTLNPLRVVISLVASLVIGLIIYFVYRKTFAGVVYSRSFNLSLVMLTMVSALVLMMISSNMALSLGMVGALSIVRFRAAIKEPVEIVFLFWSLAAGIVIGAGMIPLAVIGSAIIGVILLLLANRKLHESPYLLVVNCADEAAEKAALDIVGKSTKHCLVKAKTVNASGIELTAELRTRGGETAFLNELTRLPGIGNATLVSYNGEYMG